MEIIHIVLGKANPERMNGVNKVVFQLVSKQVEYGMQASVWGLANNNHINYADRLFDTRIFLKKKNPFAISKQLKKALISKKNQAIFHIHGGWIPVFYAIATVLHEHKIDFVFTPHGAYNTIAMERSNIMKKVYFNLFEKKLLQYTRKIHCIGESEVLGINAILPTNKTVLLPYGYEFDYNVPINPFKNDIFTLGFIGRLDIYTKGLDTLLIAFEKFLTVCPNAKLWIVGDSEERTKLENDIFKLNLSQNVTLFGSLFGTEKEAVLKQMDVFVHPSRNEGLPMSVIEAAAIGKVVIVTKATNIANLVSDFNAGFTIDNQSEEQLYDKFCNAYKIWKQPTLTFFQMQQNATKMVAETFNWDKILSDFNEKLYLLK
ncbi:glycosyltransferase family 4 protein [Flavobacterium branchiophilum]|uniref:Glycosyl transferase, group 1 family protein n=2 Tax=Flavobacterium branchiophilum TaxID=55197 RepID=G2Z2U7_FLABF|nr:glycosyltransferase family 4 protein [Flavobacterium branchiophilum]PDS23729.1 hypothetical protein B0A77_10125 [Flavobacterium branchiophilum]CCB70276.1 Glycosyl transferase, group 1 family protein [Flavobacterium branchiophilum FL-15]